MGKLDGKVALITGSGRNIGRATALMLAGEGAHVVVNARTNEAEAEAVAREVRERGVKSLAVLADLARKDQVVQALCAVRIVKPRVGMGLEFLDVEEKSHAMLERWLDQSRRP